MATLFEKHRRLGSWLNGLWFEFRAAGLRVLRGIENRRRPAVPLTSIPSTEGWSEILGKSVSPLWTAQSAAETKLVAGKVRNLRIAGKFLDGKILRAGQTFSFWECVGQPRHSRGFVEGRELREGCMIASVGGGLCQLSNALHLAALEAGFEIVERHAHSKVVPGSIAETGRDATVFWNYKDLRFRATVPFVLEVQIGATQLIVQFRAEACPAKTRLPEAPVVLQEAETAGDCLTCRHRQCVHHPVAMQINRR